MRDMLRPGEGATVRRVSSLDTGDCIKNSSPAVRPGGWRALHCRPDWQPPVAARPACRTQLALCDVHLKRLAALLLTNTANMFKSSFA